MYRRLGYSNIPSQFFFPLEHFDFLPQCDMKTYFGMFLMSGKWFGFGFLPTYVPYLDAYAKLAFGLLQH